MLLDMAEIIRDIIDHLFSTTTELRIVHSRHRGDRLRIVFGHWLHRVIGMVLFVGDAAGHRVVGKDSWETRHSYLAALLVRSWGIVSWFSLVLTEICWVSRDELRRRSGDEECAWEAKRFESGKIGLGSGTEEPVDVDEFEWKRFDSLWYKLPKLLSMVLFFSRLNGVRRTMLSRTLRRCYFSYWSNILTSNWRTQNSSSLSLERAFLRSTMSWWRFSQWQIDSKSVPSSLPVLHPSRGREKLFYSSRTTSKGQRGRIILARKWSFDLFHGRGHLRSLESCSTWLSSDARHLFLSFCVDEQLPASLVSTTEITCSIAIKKFDGRKTSSFIQSHLLRVRFLRRWRKTFQIRNNVGILSRNMSMYKESRGNLSGFK